MFHGREMRGIRILVISESTGFFLVESSCSEEFGLISTFLLGVFTVLNCVVLREKRVLRVGIGGEFESRVRLSFFFFFFFFIIGFFFVFFFFKRGKYSVDFFISIGVGELGEKSRLKGASVQFQYISVASSNPGCGFYLFCLFIFLFCLGFLHRTLT